MELFSSLFKFPLQKYLSCCTWTLNCTQGKSTSGCHQRQRRGWFSFVLWLWWKENCKQKICWFWITLPKNHFTENFWSNAFWPKHHLTGRPFDGNRIWPNTVWPNAIWPKVHLTESPFNQTPFDGKIIFPESQMTDLFFKKIVISPNLLATKNHLTEKKLHRRSFDRKLIWPNVHLTESFFW
jgi:hypothetical protein